MKVSYDKWQTVYNKGGEIEVFDFLSIENLINRLDQDVYDQIVLQGVKNYLLIGGGNGKYIVCFVVGSDDDFYTLLNTDFINDETEVSVITGGQAGLFAQKIVVRLADVISASRYYFENEDRNPDLQWINE